MPTKTTKATTKVKVLPSEGSTAYHLAKNKRQSLPGTIQVITRKNGAKETHFGGSQPSKAKTGVQAGRATGSEKRVERVGSAEETIHAAAERMSAGIPQKAPAQSPSKPSRPADNAANEEKTLARKLVAEVSKDNADVHALCDTYQLKREELGRLTGFSLRALADWASDKLPSQPARRRLREVRRLLDALAEIVKVESIPQWLHQTNPEFAPLTPLQVIELGEIDRLWAMVYTLGSDRLD